MIAYLIKSAISLLILYLVYHFLLSKEKAYQFNRYFLLGSLLFSLCVPFIQSPLTPHTKLVNATPTFPSLSQEELMSTNLIATNSAPIILEKETDNIVRSKQALPLWTIILAVYILVLLVLVIRLTINLRTLFLKIKRGPIIDQGHYKAVLSKGKDLPFTFMQYIFLEKSQFINRQVNSQLLLHEEIHARQWHSLDILFIEVLKSIFWFNPVFHLFKKAIQLNHEFIADEAVVQECEDKKSYQYLLLSHVLQQQQNHLVSYSKYSLTKNRITMMNKTKNWQKTAVKVLTVPFALGIVSMLAMRPHENTNELIVESNTSYVSLQQDDAYLKEFVMLHQSFERIMDEAKLEQHSVSMEEIKLDRMRQLWAYMSEENRAKAPKLSGIPAPPMNLNKKRPSSYQMKEWQKNTFYTIYLDKKVIPNKELKSYNQEDIAFWYYHRKYTSNGKEKDDYETEVHLQTNNGFYKTFFMNRTGYDHVSAYEKAIDIYFEHQNRPKKYEGQLGGTVNDLQQVYDQIPEWKKEMYNIKTPLEAIKGENKQNGISFNYIPYFKPQKNDKC
ncbi:M56 family metallopeptidase [Echinicola shivajiensis]|uniref:M56 family metallopeptidase n=1 Tax=Echinicola shivajiensis TaxID=1035916 RepID=UPI001BFCAFAE|nr:M56 family metallopeptidase [Echinicola shivajiensis]